MSGYKEEAGREEYFDQLAEESREIEDQRLKEQMDKEMFLDYVKHLEEENDDLKKCLNIANEAVRIASNQLEGIGLAFKVHGRNLNVQFFVDNCYKNAQEARDSQLKIKELLDLTNKKSK